MNLLKTKRLKDVGEDKVVRAYGEYRAAGFQVSEITDLLNKQFDLDYERTTYNKLYLKYQAEGLLNALQDSDELTNGEKDLPNIEDPNGSDEMETEEDAVVEALFERDPNLLSITDVIAMNTLLGKKMFTLRKKQKTMNRERAYLDAVAITTTDRKLILDIVDRLVDREVAIPINEWPVRVSHQVGTSERIYGYGDIHWGYTLKAGKLEYNTKMAMDRLDRIFADIVFDIKARGLKSAIITDLADDIEGDALRISQLLTIAECMTTQALDYANYLISKIDWLVTQLPEVEIKFYHVSTDNHSELRPYNTGRKEMPDCLQPLIVAIIGKKIQTKHEDNKYLNFEYIAAPEIILSFGEMNLLLSHGDTYGRDVHILTQASINHETKIHLYLGGHWHSYSHKNKNKYNNIQECVVFAPAVASDTDYSARKFLSSRPGFIILDVLTTEKYMTSTPVFFPIGS